MIVNPKLIFGVVLVASLGVPFYLLSGEKCSFARTSELQKIFLDVSESVLECREHGKNYSVYLASTGSSGSNLQDISFKVVDNNSEKKVKWGQSDMQEDKGDEWGIAIYKDSSEKEKETKIKVPIGNVYNKGKILITCQKSKLKFKEGAKTCSGGSFLKNTKLKFELDSGGNVKIQSENFDWSDDFKPKGLFCPY